MFAELREQRSSGAAEQFVWVSQEEAKRKCDRCSCLHEKAVTFSTRTNMRKKQNDFFEEN